VQFSETSRVELWFTRGPEEQIVLAPLEVFFEVPAIWRIVFRQGPTSYRSTPKFLFLFFLTSSARLKDLSSPCEETLKLFASWRFLTNPPFSFPHPLSFWCLRRGQCRPLSLGAFPLVSLTEGVALVPSSLNRYWCPLSGLLSLRGFFWPSLCVWTFPFWITDCSHCFSFSYFDFFWIPQSRLRFLFLLGTWRLLRNQSSEKLFFCAPLSFLPRACINLLLFLLLCPVKSRFGHWFFSRASWFGDGWARTSFSSCQCVLDWLIWSAPFPFLTSKAGSLTGFSPPSFFL